MLYFKEYQRAGVVEWYRGERVPIRGDWQVPQRSGMASDVVWKSEELRPLLRSEKEKQERRPVEFSLCTKHNSAYYVTAHWE